MLKKEDVSHILLIHSNRFDCDISEVIKNLKRYGFLVSLISENIVSYASCPSLAFKTYIENITPKSIKTIIQKEKIDAILPIFGGKKSFESFLELFKNNDLSNIKILGINPANFLNLKNSLSKKIDFTKRFKAQDIIETMQIANNMDFPIIVKSKNIINEGEIAYNEDELSIIATREFDINELNEIIIEQSLFDYNIYEFCILKDNSDNTLSTCSLEKLGIDDINIVPSLTLSKKENDVIKEYCSEIIKKIGANVCNIEFAINSINGEILINKITPRYTSISNLLSKATGYDSAKIVSSLSIGFNFDEIKNDLTKMSAAIEPCIDYIAIEKNQTLGIAKTFKEAFLKTLSSATIKNLSDISDSELERKFFQKNSQKSLYIFEALRRKKSIDKIYLWCKVNKWFLNQFKEIIEFEEKININILHDKILLRKAKTYGFSDKLLAKLINYQENLNLTENDIYFARKKQNIYRDFDEIDSSSGEFKAYNPSLYSLVNILEIPPKKIQNEEKILFIGSYKNEYDYCFKMASDALKDMNIKTISYSQNPQSILTSYNDNISYIEPINIEYIKSVINRENPMGIMVHFSSNSAVKIAKELSIFGIKTYGSNINIIDLAEDKRKLNKLVKKYHLKHVPSKIAIDINEAIKHANELSYPVIIKPSYIENRHTMKIVQNENELKAYLKQNIINFPIFIDKFLQNITKFEIDAISDGFNTFICAILANNTDDLDKSIIEKIKMQTRFITLNLSIIGSINIKFALHEHELIVLNINPRVSKNLAFISKIKKIPLVKVVARVMVQGNLKEALKFYDIKDFKEQNGIITTLNEFILLNMKNYNFGYKALQDL